MKVLEPQPVHAPDAFSPLQPDELEKINAYWRACHYLCAGMIYLRDVRERICRGLELLGIEMVEGRMSKVAVMTSEEEVQMARHCRRLSRK